MDAESSVEDRGERGGCYGKGHGTRGRQERPSGKRKRRKREDSGAQEDHKILRLSVHHSNQKRNGESPVHLSASRSDEMHKFSLSLSRSLFLFPLFASWRNLIDPYSVIAKLILLTLQ